jgi:hypothetical protein
MHRLLSFSSKNSLPCTASSANSYYGNAVSVTPSRPLYTYELLGEQGDVLNDGEAHAPLPVLRQIHNSGQQRLRQQINADNCRGAPSTTEWSVHVRPG